MKGYISFVAYVVLFGKIFYAETFARDRIRISGSSTCFLYSKIIAESFTEYFPKFKTPLVESGGSGIGLKDFCKGVGEDTVDIVNSSRKITKNELAECNKNGVSDIQEVTIGYDGIALVSDKDMKSFSVTIEDLYMALAANLFIKGNLILNPFKKWSDIRPDLPSINISIYIPSDKHGTREVIEQKVLKEGCVRSGSFAKMQNCLKYNDLQLNIACKSIRKDGLAIEVDGDYAETLARIKVNKNVFGFLGLSFYKNNADVLKIIPINGVILSVSTVTSGLYPIVRPLFFYVKKKHFSNIIGLREYVAFSVSDEMMESNSQLVKYGLIPISERERKIFRDSVVIRKKLLRRFG
ncbi:MAG: phosphonate ABC transporter substrate-binding protein [Candidatus Liberibacter europaeus]|uniref:Phosphonate ABC transporter substrate-binding protein n=1 Tax=Candidatus Liberibacter europaeus TaxID=744859 RepID=A0A2T4VXJ8_9HYPH|nr:phosphonate ABC transporter substrate-binding protein [Candidatus Liberibacter europaeus]PTL86512.1 MAG: phosphonate ABC transporter substrate-binding protein [Candidatus Liberibacter europaeus]